DEGETAEAVAECLPVIFQAVAASALTPVDKVLFAIDALLQDDYGVIGDAVDVVLEAPWTRQDWSAVADRLAARLRLSADSEGEAFSERYRRNRVSEWLTEALERAGRGDEQLAVLEAEARKTGGY